MIEKSMSLSLRSGITTGGKTCGNSIDIGTLKKNNDKNEQDLFLRSVQ